MSTPAQSPLPPPELSPPPTFDAEKWRQKLAGLTDPDSSGDAGDNPAAAEQKATAITLCCLLADLFGSSLDAKTKWDRISSALATGCAKCDDGDLDRFVTLCLEHVRADNGLASRNEKLPELLAECEAKPLSWRQGFVRYVAGHSYAVIAHARRAWKEFIAAGPERNENGDSLLPGREGAA